MKKAVSLVLLLSLVIACFSALSAVTVAAEEGTFKGLRFQAVQRDQGILFTSLSKEIIRSSLLQGQDVCVTLYNNADTEYKIYLRTDENWINILSSNVITIPPHEAAEIHCDYTSNANQILLMSSETQKCDFTICNLTEEQASLLQNAALTEGAAGSIEAQVVDNPLDNPVTLKRYLLCPEEILPHDGGALYISGRGHRCGSPSQELATRIDSSTGGKYYFAAWVRFANPPGDFESRKVEINLGIEYQINGSTKKWNNIAAITINDTEWHHIGGAISIPAGSLEYVKSYIQTVYEGTEFAESDVVGKYYAGDMICDGFMFKKYDENDPTGFGENLFADPECDPEGISAWDKYQILTITNTLDMFNGASLTVSDSLTLNYYSKFDGTVAVTHNGKVTELGGTPDGNNGYKYAYNGITPQCMNDKITAEYSIGDEVIDSLEFSVKDYCTMLVSKTAEELGYTPAKYNTMKTLLADMLDYGAAAQKYRHYHSDNLPNTDEWVALNRSTFEVPTDCKNVGAISNNNYCLYSVGVRLSDVVQLYFRFNVTDWTDVTVDVTRKGQKSKYTQSNITDDALYLDAVYATAFGDEYTVELKHNGTVMQTVTYSVNSYIASKYNGTNSELIQALGRYGASAAAFNAQ